MRSILESPYKTIFHIRQSCSDASLQKRMPLSLDGRALNVNDCAMDLIDLMSNNDKESPLPPTQFRLLSLIGSLLCVVLLFFSGLYNHSSNI